MNGHPERAVHYFDDAILVGETCKKLDPYNDQITDLINSVKSYKAQTSQRVQSMTQIDSMEAMARTNPADVQNLVMLGSACMQMQQTNRAVDLFDLALTRPEINFSETAAIAQYFAQMGNFTKLDAAIEKMVSLAPDQPEPRYDLAALQAIVGNPTESLKNLKLALDISARRLATNPSARDLLGALRNDTRFDRLRSLPEFQKLAPAK
jgi:tetratricopeptide (TPR) repeat protein